MGSLFATANAVVHPLCCRHVRSLAMCAVNVFAAAKQDFYGIHSKFRCNIPRTSLVMTHCRLIYRQYFLPKKRF